VYSGRNRLQPTTRLDRKIFYLYAKLHASPMRRVLIPNAQAPTFTLKRQECVFILPSK
jgi:hypothetical protein